MTIQGTIVTDIQFPREPAHQRCPFARLVEARVHAGAIVLSRQHSIGSVALADTNVPVGRPSARNPVSAQPIVFGYGPEPLSYDLGMRQCAIAHLSKAPRLPPRTCVEQVYGVGVGRRCPKTAISLAVERAGPPAKDITSLFKLS